MQHLWSPWRAEYLNTPQPGGCIFCLAASGQADDRLVLHIGRSTLVMLNRYPYNSGHLMIAPVRHTADITGLSTSEGLEMIHLMQAAVRALGQAYRPSGYNTGMNLGRAAGAAVADHLHLHVVPRWDGDTNFMVAVAETRVLPESLEQTAEKLRPILRQVLDEAA